MLALMRGTESIISAPDSDQITQAVRESSLNISSLPTVKEVAQDIQDTLVGTVRHLISPSVGIDSMFPDQIERMLQRLSASVGDDENPEYRGDLSELSLGGADLTYLVMKLLEYELKLSADRVAHFLLIEELEAHVHAHVQKTLLTNQTNHETQVIVSTHSTLYRSRDNSRGRIK